MFLAYGLSISIRAKTIDTALGLLICISVLVNPIFWVIYLVIIFIPVVVIFKRIFNSGMPKLETDMMIGISLFLFFPREIIVSLLNIFSLKVGTPPHNEVSFAGSLVTFLPIPVILGLMWLMRRLENG